MDTISISDFKARALSIIARVVETGEPVIVTKRGRAMVTVSSYSQPEKPAPGLLKGTVLEEKDIVSPLDPEAWEANR